MSTSAHGRMLIKVKTLLGLEFRLRGNFDIAFTYWKVVAGCHSASFRTKRQKMPAISLPFLSVLSSLSHLCGSFALMPRRSLAPFENVDPKHSLFLLEASKFPPKQNIRSTSFKRLQTLRWTLNGFFCFFPECELSRSFVTLNKDDFGTLTNWA